MRARLLAIALASSMLGVGVGARAQSRDGLAALAPAVTAPPDPCPGATGWTRIASGGPALTDGLSSAWAGRELLIISPARANVPLRVSALDVCANRWRDLDMSAWPTPTDPQRLAVTHIGDRVALELRSATAAPVTRLFTPGSPGWTSAPEWASFVGRLLVGERAIAIESRSGRFAEVDVWDVAAARSYSVRPRTAPAARTDHASAVVGERVVIVGGRDASGQLARGVDVYDARRRRWSRIAAPNEPAGRTHPIVATAGEHVLVFGGQDDRGELDDGAVLDVPHRRWTPVSAAPGLRGATERVAVLTRTSFVVLASEPNRARTVGAALDLATGAWREVTPPVQVRRSSTSLDPLPDGRVLLRQHGARELWILEPSAGSWARVELGAVGDRTTPLVAVEGARIVVLGGHEPVDDRHWQTGCERPVPGIGCDPVAPPVGRLRQDGYLRSL
ncbi:MAG: kelch repeat-containing protein [Sandaracinaceae bacterium]